MKKIYLLFAILLMCSTATKAQSVSLATSTANPSKGTIVYNDASNELQYWNGSAWIPVTNAALGTGWALNGTSVYNANTGNVGIKVTNPTSQLQIGSVGGTGFIDRHLAIGNGTSAMGIVQTNTLSSVASTTDFVFNPRNGAGRVGINTSTPTNAFQIGTPTYTNYQFAMGEGTNSTGFSQTSSAFTINSYTKIILKPGAGAANTVGINTTDPDYPLHVGLSEISGLIPYAFFYRDSETGNPVIGSTSSASANVSIYAFGGVLAGSFLAHSDARIKNIVGVSNSAQDLETIKAIQITDYTLKDKLQNGNRAFKKVIAQQVEKIYPQAVSLVKDVVPDIYTLAESLVYNEAEKTLKCSMANNYGIRIGEKLQLIHPEKGKIKAEVIEVSGNSFTVKDWQYPTDKLFVYGREVTDFRNVDYEALSMLGISAIQQLAKENEELKAKNNEFSRKFEQLSARLEALEAQLPKMPTGN